MQKWSKGKQKGKVNNLVLSDNATFDKLVCEAAKQVVTAALSECFRIMSSTKEEPPQSVFKVKTLNTGLKLAEQWVKNMHGDVEEAGEMEMEARPSRLGLGAKVPRKSAVGPFNDPVERRLHQKFGVGRKKTAGDEDSIPPPKDVLNSEDEDSRTNAFAKKRTAPLPTTSQAKKKLK